MDRSRPACAGVLLDIDGCVVTGLGRGAVPGAPQAVARLRERYALRFVTNTTSRTRAWLVAALRDAGFELDEGEVVTPTAMARAVLTGRGHDRGVLLAEASTRPDLGWFTETPPEEARAVLLATEAHERTVGSLQPAVLALCAGARLYTLQENRVYERDGRLLTDLGPVAAMLGYAAGVSWENLGKPSPLLFATLAEELGCEIGRLTMVGDDAEFDVAGSLAAGVGQAILVCTGKYRPGDESRFQPPPSAVVDSVADLPGILR